jgi:ABC-type nitrate/sulfonate/bicarbonate transport system substrate-binding protein
MTKRFLREKRDTVDGFLRAYVEALSYVKSQRDATLKVIGKYTRQRDPDVLSKFYDDLGACLSNRAVRSWNSV